MPLVFFIFTCLENFDVQWGSEFLTCSVFKWSKRGWMPYGPFFECHLNTGHPNHLNTGQQMDAILFSYVLVRYLKGWFIT